MPASIRSGMMVCSTPCSFSTPSMVTRLVPAPSILAPIELRKLARSTTSGSQAADSMMVVPLARTAAIMRLSVPRTVGPCLPRRSTSVPVRPLGAFMSMLPPSMLMSAPMARSPLRWRSTGRSPMTQPPGRETVALPRRVSSGPITQMEARILRTSSYGASEMMLAALMRTVPLERSTSAPRAESIWIM